ncbi:hypothetical protein HPP92_004641 [Vanilla planifolia]|uniref:Glycosyltransferase N-terminal domain-containing protein n=1 Tax=Vanilla planifolia TaxID=51239 RepID=A0A835RX41_VANPL|nr:hypothetical protein HPP92_004641 [Vanilla planifolia]
MKKLGRARGSNHKTFPLHSFHLMASILEDLTNARGNGIAVVTVPLPAQGHLNALLQFSAHLTNHGIDVHYIGSAIHNRQARHRTHRGFHGLIASSTHRLHFHDLPFPVIPPLRQPSTPA